MTTSASSETATATAPRVLDGIRSPADIKALNEEDLPQLAQEVRDELIKVLSQTGGHLGPNLGVVELTIALHRVFETPKDRFVFDVSHQGYVHKMFTGRLDRISTMVTGRGTRGPRSQPVSEWRLDAICEVAMRMWWSWRAMRRSPAASVMRR